MTMDPAEIMLLVAQLEPIVLDETLTKEKRQQALMEVAANFIRRYDDLDKAMDIYNFAMAFIVETNGLARH